MNTNIKDRKQNMDTQHLPELFDNESIVAFLKNIYETLHYIILKYYKFIFYTSLAFLVLGIIQSFTIPIHYKVYVDIKPRVTQNTSSSNSGLAVSILGLKGNNEDPLNDYLNGLYSLNFAKQLWNEGYNKRYFFSAFNTKTKQYEYQYKTWDWFKSKILGYSLNKVMGPEVLQSRIKGVIKLDKSLVSTNGVYRFYSLSASPDPAATFLYEVLSQADAYLKQVDKVEANENIRVLTEKLTLSKNQQVKQVIASMLQQDVLKVALTEGDSLYKIKLVDGPVVPNNPEPVNLFFRYVAFCFIGFALSIIAVFCKESFFKHKRTVFF